MKNVSFNAVLGAGIRIRREKAGIELGEMARSQNLSDAAWSRVESGRNSLSPPQLVLVSKELGCTVGDLFAAADRMARHLEATGNFRVLMRSHPRDKNKAATLGMVLTGAGILAGAAMALLGDSAGFAEDEEG